MSADASRDNAGGISMMLIATAVLAVSDTLVRYTTQTIPISQFMLLRGSLATVIIGAVVVASTGTLDWRLMLRPLVVLRAMLEASAVIAYILALQKLLIAEVTAIYLASPLIAAGFVSIFGMELVGIRRWMIMAFGFLGVLLVADPKLSEINSGAIFAVLSAVLVAIRDIVTRRLAISAPSMLVTLCTTIIVTCSGLLLVPFEAAWHAPTMSETSFLVGAALAVSAGNFLSVAAFRKGAVTVVSLFRYASLPFAMIAGLLVWGEIPGPTKIAGAIVICLSGLLLIWGSRRLVVSPAKRL